MKDFPRFEGGRSLMLASAVAGVLGLVLTAVGLVTDARPAFFSYLIAFTYWVGVAVCALILVHVFHAARAKWVVVVRRQLENMAATIPLFVLLFVPIVLGMKHLFVWANEAELAKMPAEFQHLVHHKHAYLNQTAFLVRAAIYFFVWIVFGQLMRGWSMKQDADGALVHTARSRILGPAGLPALALTITFASFDWLMSLNPTWGSTIFGVYYFSGSVLATFCVLTITSALGKGPGLYTALVTGQHLHNLGKFVLTFVAFWAYVAFSQFMLIWVSNLPEEIPWFQIRGADMSSAWFPIGVFLFVGHFVIPFFALLSRNLKYRPVALSGVALWCLFAHYVDLYWLVVPVLRPESAMPRWTDFTAFIGIGGVAIAFGILRMRGTYTVPVNDPYLPESLRYTQP